MAFCTFAISLGVRNALILYHRNKKNQVLFVLDFKNLLSFLLPSVEKSYATVANNEILCFVPFTCAVRTLVKVNKSVLYCRTI